MPRYFFAIQDGIELDDPEGTVLPDLDAALEEAYGIARDLSAVGTRAGRSRSHWSVVVKDDGGGVLVSLPFGDAAQVADHIAPLQ